MKKTIALKSSSPQWLRLEQLFQVELEESFYWLLSKLEIHRFSIEHDPIEKSTRVLFIWLPFNEWTGKEQKELVESLISLASTFDVELPPCKWIEVKDEDWSSSWKNSWQPDPVGKSILILPAWMDVPEEFLTRKIIRLDPGSAFGTGSHPSTRLCIEALDQMPPIGQTIADIGCGSGILSLTALKLGANSAYSVDIDSLAISATKINSALNNFSDDLLNVFHGSIEEIESNMPRKKIDLVLCNILAPVIKLIGPDLKKIIAHKGKLVLSGLLVEQLGELQEFFSSLGWQVQEIKTMDLWALMVLTLIQ